MPEIKDLRIALIGGAGFIGHHLALSLAGARAEVHVVDSLQVNNLLAFKSHNPDLINQDLYLRIIHERLELLDRAGIPLHVQDARDYHALSALINQIGPNVIIHLAAVAHAGRANKDPYSTFDHSLRTLENALDCARDRLEHFIYFSSSMVYGNFAEGTVTEESPCDPIGIYGALKFAGEKMVIAYNQVFDLPYTIIRPSALYGERCVSRRVGQIFIESALSGSHLTVFGEGDEELDFTYIQDLLQGIHRVLECDAARGHVFNLTHGNARSTSELVRVLEQHFPGLDVEYKPKDRLMPERGTLSVDKARQLLGYQPAFSIEEGFARYVDWYKSIWT